MTARPTTTIDGVQVPLVLTTSGAAALLGRSETTVQSMVRRGELHNCIPEIRAIRISAAEIRGRIERTTTTT